MKCTVCDNDQVRTIDTLLGSGTSIREVSRLFGHSRSSVSRHKQHARVARSRLGVIPGDGGRGGTGGPLEPFAEALALSRRAKTDRELLKAAEAVRSSTALEMRALRGGQADTEMLERLDANVVEAAQLYRRVGGFENELRGLAGHREAIRQRLDAVRIPEAIEVPLVITYPGSEPRGDPAMVKMARDTYFKGVPMRFRDPDRYTVHRRIKLAYGEGTPVEEVRVRKVASGVVAWAK